MGSTPYFPSLPRATLSAIAVLTFAAFAAAGCWCDNRCDLDVRIQITAVLTAGFNLVPWFGPDGTSVPTPSPASTPR